MSGFFRGLAVIGLMLAVAGVAQAGSVTVCFQREGNLIAVQRPAPDGMPAAEAAVLALVAGPSEQERLAGMTSAIPDGATVVNLVLADGILSVDLSQEVLTGLDDAAVEAIFAQFRATLVNEPLTSIRLTCQGSLLSKYLKPVEWQSAAPQPAIMGAEPVASGVAGRNITIGPSHGRFWNGSGWYWQRTDPCGFGEAVLEDTNSIRLMQFLYQYLTQDGATVHVPRELNESNCCNGYEGLHWWKMAAYSWLRANGLPCSVWASYTGNCGQENAVGRNSDDIRARPLFADYRGSEIYVACHTNAGGGGTANGTETFRDTSMEHPAHEAASYNLALSINNNIINSIREMYDGAWSNRGVKDSAGGFGEIRIPNRPACLIELAFHDNCSRDAQYLTDNFFRSVAEWGVYKGICEYFGSSPTWDRYSDELVSNTIPSTMMAGQSYNVSVTFRNRGVVWSNARAFRLGAVGDSDPFTGFTRVNISGEVRPGNQYTFNFTMVAPTTSGTYTTDWRMVRDGVAWFGATLTKSVQVGSPDTQPPTTPTNLTANATGPNTVQLAWTASTDDIGVVGYDVRRNGAVVGSAATNSYTDSSAPADSTLTYEVRARDGAPNYSGWSNSATAITPPAPPQTTNIFTEGFNGSLGSWTQGAVGYTYSTTVNRGGYTGPGAAYMAAGAASQMYRSLGKPFAQGRVWGYFYDGKGGWKAGVCGNAYRQALSLRDPDGAAKMYIDNEFYSASDNSKYFFRTVGTGGIGHTAYATRNAATDCNAAWVYFETTVNPAAPGAGGTFVAKVADGAGTTTTTQNLTSDFFSWGIGRVHLGLGATSANEGYWDDIGFEARPPEYPLMGTPVAGASSIQWTFSPRDNNMFGYDVGDAAGVVKSASYPASGWIGRAATSWNETGLASNTQYTRKVRGWNGTLNGAWSAPASAWTLSAAPGAGSVTPEPAAPCVGQAVTWTASGFGAGYVQYYRYVFDQNATYTFTGSEGVWSGGTLVVSPTLPGTWYLHLQGYNGADVPNGTYDYAVATPVYPADFNGDCHVDEVDFEQFEICALGADVPQTDPNCDLFNFDDDSDVDLADFGVFQRCYSGESQSPEPACDQ